MSNPFILLIFYLCKIQLAGATYMEIMREGGGIGFTVEQTKLATDKELIVSLVARLERMLQAGKS